MSRVDQVIEEVSNLPLFDAAYYLAANVGQLSRDERGEEVSSHHQPADYRAEPGTYARIEAGEYSNANMDHGGARNKGALPDVNFDLLSKAHPEAGEEDIKVAFRAVAKLLRDAHYHFSHGSDYMIVVRRTNPGFQEQTYQRVSNRLAFDMR